jgi:hypothetical protein
MKPALPPELRAQLKQERRDATEAAKIFARVCESGSEDELRGAASLLYEQIDAWRPAFVKVAKLPCVTKEVQNAFLSVWIENKMLPLHVGNRRVCADALRVLMPADYSGSPLTLYRGTAAHERRRRLYGFSWTLDIAIARKFAKHWAQPLPAPLTSEGVVLKTVARPEAILLVRQPENYFDEGEVVVDPFQLDKVDVIERLCREKA